MTHDWANQNVGGDVDKFYRFTEQWIATVFLLAFVFFLCWAGLVIALQLFGWLTFAEWQPVPFGAFFLSPDGHKWIAFFQGKTQPLNLIPALGAARDIEQVAIGLAGNLIGLGKVLAFLLNTHVSLWLFAAGAGCLAVSNSADTTP